MEPSNTTVKRVSSGVWALEQEIVRCFLIVGQQRALLLDTGAEACDLMGMIREITPLPLVVLNTHGDGDHTANNNQFRDIHAHPDEFATIRRFRPDLTSTLHPITALSAFDLGDRVLHVIETPGHTPGSICLLDRKNRILFSGDTLFAGSVGRTDFPGGSMSALVRSIKEKLTPLPDETKVYPGHMEESTIGAERRYNPYLGG